MENKIEELVIIEKTIGDSRGYLWKVIIDQHHSVARIEKVSIIAWQGLKKFLAYRTA